MSIVEELERESLDDVYIARVMRKHGSGRFGVCFYDNNKQLHEEDAVVRGSMRRGAAKRAGFVEVNGYVVIHDTGLKRYEIIEVLSMLQLDKLRKTRRFHILNVLDQDYELFDYTEDVDVDAI